MVDADGVDSDPERVLAERVTSFKLRLVRDWPFYGTLAMHASYRLGAPRAHALGWTDGRDIWLEPRALDALSREELEFVLLHEILHCALHHVRRRGQRDPFRWNVAADVVVNALLEEVPTVRAPEGIITAASLRRPLLSMTRLRAAGAPAQKPLDVSGMSAEQVYDLVPTGFEAPSLWVADLEAPGRGAEGDQAPPPALDDDAIERHWTTAFERAVVQHGFASGRARASGRRTPALQGLIDRPRSGRTDWRTELWEHLVRTPTDFVGIDRRFVAQEMYLDVLDGESLRVVIAVDTSGSIGPSMLARFTDEVLSIVGCYPHVEAEFFWADHELDGPHPLSRGMELPPVTGGRGTDFRPFFAHLEGQGPLRNAVAVYLTDGFGWFPPSSSTETIWLVPVGGLADADFPFGRVLRMAAA